MLAEHNLRIKACLEVVTPDTAHVLNDHGSDLARFNVGNQALPIGSFKIAAAPTVVGVVGAVCKTVLCRVAFEVGFLERDLSRIFLSSESVC